MYSFLLLLTFLLFFLVGIQKLRLAFKIFTQQLRLLPVLPAAHPLQPAQAACGLDLLRLLWELRQVQPEQKPEDGGGPHGPPETPSECPGLDCQGLCEVNFPFYKISDLLDLYNFGPSLKICFEKGSNAMKQLQIVILSKELFTSELRKTNTDKRFGSNSMDFKLLQCFFNFKVLSIVIMANSQN